MNAVVGGHAVMAVGYHDTRAVLPGDEFLGLERWGDGGFFTLPYAYLTDDDLSADFWTVGVVEV